MLYANTREFVLLFCCLKKFRTVVEYPTACKVHVLGWYLLVYTTPGVVSHWPYDLIASILIGDHLAMQILTHYSSLSSVVLRDTPLLWAPTCWSAIINPTYRMQPSQELRARQQPAHHHPSEYPVLYVSSLIIQHYRWGNSRVVFTTILHMVTWSFRKPHLNARVECLFLSLVMSS